MHMHDVGGADLAGKRPAQFWRVADGPGTADRSGDDRNRLRAAISFKIFVFQAGNNALTSKVLGLMRQRPNHGGDAATMPRQRSRDMNDSAAVAWGGHVLTLSFCRTRRLI